MEHQSYDSIDPNVWKTYLNPGLPRSERSCCIQQALTLVQYNLTQQIPFRLGSLLFLIWTAVFVPGEDTQNQNDAIPCPFIDCDDTSRDVYKHLRHVLSCKKLQNGAYHCKFHNRVEHFFDFNAPSQSDATASLCNLYRLVGQRRSPKDLKDFFERSLLKVADHELRLLQLGPDCLSDRTYSQTGWNNVETGVESQQVYNSDHLIYEDSFQQSTQPVDQLSGLPLYSVNNNNLPILCSPLDQVMGPTESGLEYQQTVYNSVALADTNALQQSPHSETQYLSTQPSPEYSNYVASSPFLFQQSGTSGLVVNTASFDPNWAPNPTTETYGHPDMSNERNNTTSQLEIDGFTAPTEGKLNLRGFDTTANADSQPQNSQFILYDSTGSLNMLWMFSELICAVHPPKVKERGRENKKILQDALDCLRQILSGNKIQSAHNLFCIYHLSFVSWLSSSNTSFEELQSTFLSSIPGLALLLTSDKERNLFTEWARHMFVEWHRPSRRHSSATARSGRSKSMWPGNSFGQGVESETSSQPHHFSASGAIDSIDGTSFSFRCVSALTGQGSAQESWRRNAVIQIVLSFFQEYEQILNLPFLLDQSEQLSFAGIQSDPHCSLSASYDHREAALNSLEKTLETAKDGARYRTCIAKAREALKQPYLTLRQIQLDLSSEAKKIPLPLDSFAHFAFTVESQFEKFDSSLKESSDKFLLGHIESIKAHIEGLDPVTPFDTGLLAKSSGSFAVKLPSPPRSELSPDTPTSSGQNAGDGATFTCHDCGKEFRGKAKNAKANRSRHIEEQHTERENLPCPKCEKTFTRQGNLDQHLSNKHQISKSKRRRTLGY